MGKFLAEREDAFEEKERWRGRKVMSYISQVMLNKRPLSKIGLRSYREVLSIGPALDHLLQGQLAECGDLLMQRLKALETSFQDQLSRRRVVLSESREDEGKAKAAEDAECSALGNSFHTGAVAGLFDLLLWSMGKKGMKKIQQAFLEQLADIECIKEEATEDETSSESVKVGERNDEADFDASDREEVLSSCSDKTAKLSKATEDRKWPVVTGQTLTEQVYTQGDLRLSSALVSQFCRRQEAKGCDVRLDLGTLYRADAFPGPP